MLNSYEDETIDALAEVYRLREQPSIDLEKLIDDCLHPYWSSYASRPHVWASLMAMRSTLHACGFSTDSKEYEDICFLLDIYFAKGELGA